MRLKLDARLRQTLLVPACLFALASGFVPSAIADEPARGAGRGHVTPVFATQLPNVPGKSLTAVLVRYAPGEASPPHHHAGSVFAYVLSGEIRSQTSVGGPARVYKPGESFFEPPGSDHLVSANASTTEPASLLAIFVADDGASLTVPNK